MVPYQEWWQPMLWTSLWNELKDFRRALVPQCIRTIRSVSSDSESVNIFELSPFIFLFDLVSVFVNRSLSLFWRPVGGPVFEILGPKSIVRRTVRFVWASRSSPAGPCAKQMSLITSTDPCKSSWCIFLLLIWSACWSSLSGWLRWIGPSPHQSFCVRFRVYRTVRSSRNPLELTGLRESFKLQFI